MADNNDVNPFFNNKLSSILMGVGSAVFVVTMYRFLSMILYNQHDHITNQNATEPARSPAGMEEGTLNSVSHMIPAHKYEKKKKKKKNDGVGDGDGDGDDDEDGTCAVCLGDFEEGEELRTLPECMHSFHVPCIDMWLYSHSSCPICRGDATPSSGQLNEHHNIDMMQIELVQNGLVRG